MTGSTVTLQWQAPDDWGTGCPENDNHYLLNVIDDTTGYYLQDSQGDLYKRKRIDPPTTSETIPLDGLEGHDIGWRVITSNGSLENNGLRGSFHVAAGISGTVYLDSNNSCSTAQAWTSGGLTASLRGTSYSDAVDGQGAFAIAAPAGSYTLDMTVPSGYVCSTGPLGTGCGGGCPSQTSVTAPSVGNNFFFTQKRSAWWQAVGGNVYAGTSNGGTAIRSLIPATVPAAERYLLLGDGVVIHRSGSLALDAGGAAASPDASTPAPHALEPIRKFLTTCHCKAG